LLAKIIYTSQIPDTVGESEEKLSMAAEPQAEYKKG